MLEKIDRLLADAREEILQATSPERLEELRVKYLGRKGAVRDLMKGLSDVAVDQKAAAGKAVNELKGELTQLLTGKAPKQREKGAAPAFDVTLPGERPNIGKRHPIMQTLQEMIRIFGKMGFSVAEGPEVELAYYNFDALNIPPGHPARDERDNFYLGKDVLLRTQTSPVQVRVMEKTEPPLRYIAPGRVYRPDTVDASHSFMFHQLEGFAVDVDITFADLKAVLTAFAHEFYGSDVRSRLRPHYFPFTEPSAEMDISCLVCGGEGCALCSQKGWLEVCGSGMIHPEVLKASGIDPERYTGFAFGFGIERPCMLKHGIDDIRLFFENDLRFLSQF